MTFEWADLLRLLAATAAGTVLGIERELHAKPAGLRTNIMICVGAAIFTLMSIKMADASSGTDRGRIAAQVVTGIGFLGAGAIIHMRRYVFGLTTAATIWVVAAVGMAFGAGEYGLGSLATLLTAAVLFGFGFAESSISQWRTVARFEAELELDTDTTQVIDPVVHQMGIRRKTWTINKKPDCLVVRFKAIGPAERLKDLQRALLKHDAIRSLRRL